MDQTPTRCYATDQCEPKLFAIYTIDAQGKKERQGDVLYDGTVQSAACLFALLKLRLKQWGITQAREFSHHRGWRQLDLETAP